MLKKLKAALAKVGKRLSAREGEEAKAASKAHKLSGEIKALRGQIDSTTREHADTLQKLKALRESEPPGSPRVTKLEDLSAKQGEEIGILREKLEHKIGRRSSWRKRRIKAKKRAAWWLKRQTILRRKFKKAKAKWEKEHRLDFQPWMLNGCPETHNPKLKEIIAFQVVVCHQYVTATSNGTHAAGSYHYQDEAVDTGSTSVMTMEAAASKTRHHFGVEHFLELFSPCGWYIKNGVVYAGHFPGHGDHGHYAAHP